MISLITNSLPLRFLYVLTLCVGMFLIVVIAAWLFATFLKWRKRAQNTVYSFIHKHDAIEHLENNGYRVSWSRKTIELRRIRPFHMLNNDDQSAIKYLSDVHDFEIQYV